MKVLWFTNTPSLYKKNDKGYNGGGWIESLEHIVADEKDIELGISFFHNDNCFKSKERNTTYYPIPLYNTKLNKICHTVFNSKYDEIELSYYLKVIRDFQPDVIHVFGSERSFGLLSTKTAIPVVIHLQGILIPSLNSYFAPGSCKLEIYKHILFSPVKSSLALRSLSLFAKHSKREEKILRQCTYFMGRTAWDKAVVSLYAPSATYFYCSEVLRSDFYEALPWKFQKRNKIFLSSTLSKTSYKGFDLILKTAKLLKDLTDVDFEWRIFGINEYKEWEYKLGIKCKDVNVHLRGVVEAKKLVEELLNTDLFIHPSYIDNSPNSVCEAQLLGLPVISTNVGGISSLIDHDKNGLLVPANDPWMLASNILMLHKKPQYAQQLGENARITALERHNPENIKKDLVNVYQTLLGNRQK